MTSLRLIGLIVFSYLVGVYVAFGLYGDMAFAFGYMFVSLLVAGFLFRRTRELLDSSKSKSWGARYCAFSALILLQLSLGYLSQTRELDASVREGCLSQNPLVAQMPSEADRNTFCSCYGNNLASPVLREMFVANLTFSDPGRVNSPSMEGILTSAFLACAAELE
jgi:hypothetical protein